MHNVFTKELNKLTLSWNDDKRMQQIDLIEAYTYGMSKDLVSEKEVIKCNNIIKRSKNDSVWWSYKIKNPTRQQDVVATS